ncbi:MAG: TlpA disulfide reductase family protein [Pseudomonadota bacterium]
MPEFRHSHIHALPGKLPARAGGALHVWILLFLLAAALFVSQVGRAGELLPVPDAVPVPELVLPDLDGREYRLSDLRGRVVLVNFWATWCQPCLRELPNLARLQAAYADLPFTILAIDVEEDARRVRHFAAQHNLAFPVLLDADGSEFAAWGSKVLPTTFVVDAAGKIRYVGIADLEWDAGAVRTKLDGLIGDMH